MSPHRVKLGPVDLRPNQPDCDRERIERLEGSPGAPVPRDRPPQPAAPGRERRRPPRVHEEARRLIARRLQQDGRAVPRVFRERGHRPIRPATPAARTSARGRSTTSRSSPATRSSWTSSPTSSPTASCSCPRTSRTAKSGPSSSASTAWRAGPRDVADPKVENPAYHQYAVRLAEQGFITFAPQNLYIFEDRFRTLQRKANPLKKTLFSVIVPQHQQITDWLKTLPYVDPARIAFYGLSLRRQVGDADSAAGEELLPVDLLGRLQRVGLEERLDRRAHTATSGRPSTRSSSSTWAARSTTPRWRP